MTFSKIFCTPLKFGICFYVSVGIARGRVFFYCSRGSKAVDSCKWAQMAPVDNNGELRRYEALLQTADLVVHHQELSDLFRELALRSARICRLRAG